MGAVAVHAQLTRYLLYSGTSKEIANHDAVSSHADSCPSPHPDVTAQLDALESPSAPPARSVSIEADSSNTLFIIHPRTRCKNRTLYDAQEYRQRRRSEGSAELEEVMAGDGDVPRDDGACIRYRAMSLTNTDGPPGTRHMTGRLVISS